MAEDKRKPSSAQEQAWEQQPEWFKSSIGGLRRVFFGKPQDAGAFDETTARGFGYEQLAKKTPDYVSDSEPGAGSVTVTGTQTPKEEQTPQKIMEQYINMFGTGKDGEKDPGKLASEWAKKYGLGIGDPQTIQHIEKTQMINDFENNAIKTITNNTLMKYLISGGNFEQLAELMVDKPQVSRGALDKKLATGPVQMANINIPPRDRQMLAGIISGAIGNALKGIAGAVAGGDAMYYSGMSPGNVVESTMEVTQILNTSLEKNIQEKRKIDAINTELLQKYGDDVTALQSDYEKRDDAAAWMYNQAKIQYANNAFNQAMSIMNIQRDLASRDMQFQMANKDIDKWNAAAKNQVNLARANLRNGLVTMAMKASAMQSKHNLPETWKSQTKGIANYAGSRGTPSVVSMGNSAMDAVQQYANNIGIEPFKQNYDSARLAAEKIKNSAEAFAFANATPQQLDMFYRNYSAISLVHKKQFVDVKPEYIKIMMSSEIPPESIARPAVMSDEWGFIRDLPDNPEFGALQVLALTNVLSGTGEALGATAAQTGVNKGKSEVFFAHYE